MSNTTIDDAGAAVDRAGEERAPPLTTKEVVALGSLGGVTVSFGAYPDIITGNFEALLAPGAVEWAGFALRVAVFAAIGGLWGYLHRPESHRMRAFELGVLAPAALASLIYANYDPKETGAPQEPAPIEQGYLDGQGSGSGLALFTTAAHAAPLVPLSQELEPQESLIERLIRGFLGK